ncbi:hypothetical protein [uncultured Pseudoalteromonas sp.]|uniref:hypothetical protein n=1 Tax=uncultured Pseudoalteromonas sp. TaxID=114053 RepID=UPI0025938496|nr:hypothetical protein [uncultured Pseudoalteromonas sp.]
MKTPPLILVKTWYQLLKSDDQLLSQKGQAMLLGAFGSMEDVAEYLKKHKLL